MAKELYNNLVIKGSLVLFNMVAPHGEKPYFVVAESSVRNFVKYLVLQRSDLACLQILLYHTPEVQEAVCRGDRPHGARGPEVRGRGPGVQSGAQGGVRPLHGAARRGGDCTGVQFTVYTVTGSCSP